MLIAELDRCALLDDMHDAPSRYPAADAYTVARALAEKYEDDVEVAWRYARAAYNYSGEGGSASAWASPLSSCLNSHAERQWRLQVTIM